MIDRLTAQFSLHNLAFVLSAVQLVWLVWFFYTGFGGALELVAHLMSVALALQILFMYQQGYFYRWLPPIANHVLVALYLGICLLAFIYFHFEYERLAIYAMGTFTRNDFIVGLLVFLLVMELSRIAHPILFWTNVFMVVYTLWGFLSPVDFFWHPGVSFYRVVTSSTVEFSTGVYGSYGQLALTLIAAFLLLAGVANGFNAQHAMIRVVRLIARSRRLIPQTAVVGSSAIGLVSGSGSANAAVVGTITIPLMMRYGVPGTFAAAVETAASMGGLIDPPMMGAAAFLMAEFMGVPYWDVVLRGWALTVVYYLSIAFAVYLICVRILPGDRIAKPKVPLYDRVTTVVFFCSVAYLVYLMGFVGKGELLSALYTAIFMLCLLAPIFLFFKYVVKEPTLEGETLLGSIRRGIETHAEMTSYLTLLLATLGIMIGLFTVTGFINRMGGMLLDLGAWNIVAMIGMAWVFGWLAGTGLPPTATYIIGAVVIVPPMRKLGIDPWVAHFFVFLLSVWGELSPPTSLTAAVSARIANVSFMQTMFQALKICAPITLMTFAIFSRSNMVTTTGWWAIADTALVLASTLGIAFAMFGRTHNNRAVDVMLRCLVAAIAFVTMFHPDMSVSAMVAGVVVLAVIGGVVRHVQLAPKTYAIEASDTASDSELAPVLASAKRDIG
ncbi:MAG TPA: TRAP transporter fused permease subunit [Hyphomicrobiaceae bacterium]|jgi:TRAP transporter 4TM/12TM fusion protein|nr:TRAP transporter fused permease subunit [Hyphomicrobiaceae bacterium]